MDFYKTDINDNEYDRLNRPDDWMWLMSHIHIAVYDLWIRTTASLHRNGIDWRLETADRMARYDDPTLTDLVRTSPLQMTLLSAVPLILAVGQLANGLLTDLPLWAAIVFAVTMVASAVALTSHHCAEVRLERLERELRRPGAE